MSKAGRPSQRALKNGNHPNPNVPPDIEWDEDNPPFIYNCTQHIEHNPRCNGECGGKYYVESEVKLANLGRAFARENMSFVGTIKAYEQVIPVPGFAVDPLDMLLWLEELKEIIVETTDTTVEEFDERFRQRKIRMLEQTYESFAPAIKEARTAAALGITEKKIFGPDGQPLN